MAVQVPNMSDVPQDAGFLQRMLRAKQVVDMLQGMQPAAPPPTELPRMATPEPTQDRTGAKLAMGADLLRLIGDYTQKRHARKEGSSYRGSPQGLYTGALAGQRNAEMERSSAIDDYNAKIGVREAEMNARNQPDQGAAMRAIMPSLAAAMLREPRAEKPGKVSAYDEWIASRPPEEQDRLFRVRGGLLPRASRPKEPKPEEEPTLDARERRKVEERAAELMDMTNPDIEEPLPRREALLEAIREHNEDRQILGLPPFPVPARPIGTGAEVRRQGREEGVGTISYPDVRQSAEAEGLRQEVQDYRERLGGLQNLTDEQIVRLIQENRDGPGR